ncbi:unnamed protein product [Dovyalis caffra]|uniref:Uncharacterized protein n=1 Tax=Dovyalis caffra TaxID=77055 RepID=A0AAV1QW96_9ROSI|nr:unnamed protein product [Dovyalis caffra]CAK7325085.1 unnamed protein product [Dovyalis caffra]
MERNNRQEMRSYIINGLGCIKEKIFKDAPPSIKNVLSIVEVKVVSSQEGDKRQHDQNIGIVKGRNS